MTCDRRIAVQRSTDPVRPLQRRTRRSPAGRLGSYVITALLERNPRLEGVAVDEVIFRPPTIAKLTPRSNSLNRSAP